MTSTNDAPPPVEPDRRTQPTTQEIPVAQPTVAAQHPDPQLVGPAHAGPHPTGPQGTVPKPLPPHPGAVSPVPASGDQLQPTGPVDFVPGLPGTPPVPAPAASPPASTGTPGNDAVVWPDTLEADDDAGRPHKRRRVGAPRDRSAVLGVGLAVLSLVLLELGLALGFGVRSYWSAVPLWSAFATLCAVLGVLAFAAAFPSGSRLRSSAVWRIAAAGLVGLAVFWVLVVLPVVASDRGFLLTAALGALGGAVWFGPARKA